MSDPLVSVVILTHLPQAEALRRAIESVLAQSFQGFEIVLVDSGGHPETAAIAGGFKDARIRHRKAPKHSTIAQGRNAGVRRARGRLIAFLDDDDEWLPAKLERQVRLFQTSDLPDLGLVTCPVWIVNDEMSRVRREPLFERPLRGNLFGEALNLCGSTGAIPSRSTAMVFLKEALLDVGLFDERLLSAEDWELLIRLTRRWQVDVVPEPLALCHQNSGAWKATSGKKRSWDVESHRLLMNRHFSHIARVPGALGRHWLLLAEDYMRLGDWRGCRGAALQAIRQRPRPSSAWVLWLAALSPHSLRAYRALLGLRSYLGWRLLGKKIGAAGAQRDAIA